MQLFQPDLILEALAVLAGVVAEVGAAVVVAVADPLVDAAPDYGREDPGSFPTMPATCWTD